MVDSAAALKLATAIQTQEGYYPGSLAYRNNNPGNLRFAGQAGAVQGEGGFAAFPSYKDGLAALLDQIQLNARRGADAAGRPVVTVADLISSWAPPNENNTPAYIASVERQTGFSGSDALNSLNSPATDYWAGNTDGADAAGFSVADLTPVQLGVAGAIAAAAVWLVIR